jgi:hypothetical protein
MGSESSDPYSFTRGFTLASRFNLFVLDAHCMRSWIVVSTSLDEMAKVNIPVLQIIGRELCIGITEIDCRT